VQQVAMIGLIKAVDRFDPTRGIAFSSFAVPTILGELKRHFRDRGWSVRVPREVQELTLRIERITERLTGELGRSPTVDEIAAASGASPEKVLEARGTITAHHPISLHGLAREDDEEGAARLVGHEDPGYGRAEQRADLDKLLSTLSEREQTVLRLRFHEDLLQREIAERMGLSQMHVSRLIANAIATLQATRPSRESDADAAPSSARKPLLA